MARGGRPTRGKADIKGELILTAVMFVGIFAITLVLRVFLHMDTIYAPIFAAVIAAIIILFLFRRAQKRRWDSENADAEKTVNPIIERYAASHSPRQLMRDYGEWSKGQHEPDLQLQFLQLIVEMLMDDGHKEEARTMLRRMERVATETGNARNFAHYKADVESRL